MLALRKGGIMENQSNGVYEAGLSMFSECEFEKAYELFKKAGMEGNGNALYAAGLCCESGLGTKIDRKAYLHWMTQGASVGHAGARGEVLLEGLTGTIDKEKALDLTEEEALNGNPFAQGSLGFLYLYGEDAPTDLEQAFSWIARSCTPGRSGFWMVSLFLLRFQPPDFILEFLARTWETYQPVPVLKTLASMETNYAALRLALVRNG
jgi:TPR repeat protein